MSRNVGEKPAGAHRRSWIDRFSGLLAVAVGSLAAVALAEVGLRVAGVGNDQLLRQDPVLGVRFIASRTGLSQGPCYRATVSVNSDGWRGPEVSLAKPDGVYRVLVLGDSYMAAVQVQDEETFASALERELNRRTSRRPVEVINMSVPSWGTDQEYLAFREYGLGYKPDMVVLAFLAQNDVGDNVPVRLSETAPYPKPFFDVRDGELVELDFHSQMRAPVALAFRLAARFRLYPLVRDSLLADPTVRQLFYRLGMAGAAPSHEPVAGSRNPSMSRWPVRWAGQTGVYLRDDSDFWTHAWKITEGILTRTRDEVEGAKARFLLVEIASPIAVMPAAVLSGLVPDLGSQLLDVDKPTRLLGEVAERNGIDFVSLVPAFRVRTAGSEAELIKYYLGCDGHWTPDGHRLAAELAAREVAKRIPGASNE